MFVGFLYVLLEVVLYGHSQGARIRGEREKPHDAWARR
jgi:hypothetical protein